jgi:eukaryotic-like serine/threonine-protein kinase
MDALFERAQPVVTRHGAPRQRAEFLSCEYLTRILRERYRASDRTLATSRRFLAAREELGDPVDIARAHFNVGFVLLSRGDLAEAQSELEHALATAERTGDATLRSRSLTYLAMLHRRRRDVRTAEAFAERARATAAELHMPEYVALAHATLGWVAWMDGEPDRARSETDAALESIAASAFAIPYQWTVRLPLLAIALDQRRIADAVAQAQAIVGDGQQALTDKLENALRDAADARSLAAAVELAVAEGYL